MIHVLYFIVSLIMFHKILVSAPVFLELIWAFGPGFDLAGPLGVGTKGLGLGLDNWAGATLTPVFSIQKI